MRTHIHLAAGAVLALSSSCVLAPAGLRDERASARGEGAQYVAAVEARTLPDLPEEPSWRDVLRRALLANGEIEAAWQEWRAALARVDVASAWPDTNVELGLEYLLSPGNVKAWDRTTLRVGFDPMKTLSLPTKTAKRGELALAGAKAAGDRFRAAKFALQARVLERWYDLARIEEENRIRAEELVVLRLDAEASLRSAGAGGDARGMLRSRIELRRAEDALERSKSMCSQMCAQLYADAGGVPGGSLTAPRSLPEPRALPLNDAQVFALAAESNPELARLAHEVEGRRDALELARMQYWPDVVPSAGLMGSATRFVGLALSLPTNVPALRAGVEEARADLAGDEARARQARTDVGARITAELLAFHDAERAADLLDRDVRPLAERLRANAHAAYSAGTIPQREWLESLRTELEVRLAAADARIAREKSLVRLETIVGADFEAFADPEASHE